MAVANKLVNAQDNTHEMELVEYEAGGEKVVLSLDTVKKYLTDNSNVTDSEAMMFLNLCRYQHLNPFLREAYLIKYGTSKATMVVGKETFVKRARARSDFDGFEAGLIVLDKDGNIVERQGSCRTPTDQILGGWARVYIKGMQVPYYASVEWGEYAGTDKYGKLNPMWASKGMTMIRKVALCQALREAFPVELGGLYQQEEINTIDKELPEEPIEMPQKQEEPEVIDVEVEEVDDEESVAKELFG